MSKDGMVSETPKHCKGCAFREGVRSGTSHCVYSIITGKLRNCPPEECTHYVKKRTRKKEQISLKE